MKTLLRLRRLAPIVVGYLAVACWTTWPALVRLGVEVPGAERTDLWNSLWSLWFVGDAVSGGSLPYHTELLNFPDGGTILVSDPLGALFSAVLGPAVGLAAAYTLLVFARLTASGVVAHLFAEDLLGASADRPEDVPAGAGWVAGLGYATAPVLLSGVQNGTSESFAGAWAALAAWACWRVAAHGGRGRVVLAALALLGAALANGYGAVVAFLFASALVVVGARPPWRRSAVARASALVLGLALVAPVAWAFQQAATGPDNLVGIKNDRELRSVRRTVGAADPLGYLVPGDFRSPDFRTISRYAEGFFHCHYLGYVLILGAGLALGRRRRGSGFIWLAGIGGLVLSLGPVLVRNGMAVILMGDRAVPLPYLLVEPLPGFSSLSLLYRLGQAPALALSLLAAAGFARGRWPLVAALAILVEGRLLSPLGSLPDTMDAVVDPAVAAIADAPDGAVMNFPIVGGRAYLYEQTVHHKPVAGTLNFPNNLSSRRVWKAMLEAGGDPPEEFQRRVGARAREEGIRYIVVHIDPMARPDMHDEAVHALKLAMEPFAGSEGTGAGEDVAGSRVRVYRLW